MEFEAGGIFLDISKALVSKYGMMDWFLSCIKMVFAVKGLEDFLSDRKQRFAVNCQCSTCIDIHARTFVIYSQNLVGGPVLI